MVVSVVADGTPAAGVLEPGDVITDVSGEGVDTPEAALLRLGTQLVAGPVAVTVVRRGEVVRAELRPDRTPDAPAAGRLALQTVRNAGTRLTSIPAASVLATSGLQPGDVIVRAGLVTSPTAAQLRRIIAETEPAAFLVLTVRRDNRQRLVTVQLPADDVARR